MPHVPNAAVNWTSYSYDALGRTLSVTAPDTSADGWKPGVLTNSQCGYDNAASSKVGSGQYLTLNLNLRFNHQAFVGDRVFFIAARDTNEQNNTDWHAMAAWVVP